MDSGKMLFIMLLLFILALKILSQIRQNVASHNTAEIAAMKASEQSAEQLQKVVAQLQNQREDTVADNTQAPSVAQKAEESAELSEKGSMSLF